MAWADSRNVTTPFLFGGVSFQRGTPSWPTPPCPQPLRPFQGAVTGGPYRRVSAARIRSTLVGFAVALCAIAASLLRRVPSVQYHAVTSTRASDHFGSAGRSAGIAARTTLWPWLSSPDVRHTRRPERF